MTPAWASRGRTAATACGVLVVALVLVAVGAGARLGWTAQEALDSFALSNGLIGLSFGVCGAVLVRHRPTNAVGWALLACGLAHATAAAVAPVAGLLLEADAPTWVLRLLVTVFAWSWPWSIALFLPLALVLFPDGRPPSPRWRPAVVALVVTAPLFVVAVGATPEPLTDGLPVGYLTLDRYDELQPLWTSAEVRNLLALALAVAALATRYVRAADRERRQILWLLLAALVVGGAVVPWAFVAGTPVVVLLAIPLVPVAVTVAIVRHQLLDIRLVVSRGLTWLLLSLGALAVYVVLVAALDRLVSAQLGRSAVATVVVAVAVAPLLPRLQRLVDRALYGDRGDATVVAARVGQELLAGPARGLPDVVVALRGGLRLPFVAVRTDGAVVAEDGRTDGPVVTLELRCDGDLVGDLQVGLRSGERRLSGADRDVLALVGAPLAVALHGLRLAAEVQASRGRLVAAREEERRRLRRELHDGLGPTLTGLALTADAAANLVDRDPAASRALLDSIRTDTRTALDDVRRVVEDLRPPALDELGLTGALRRRVEQLSRRPDGTSMQVTFEVVEPLPGLPAAVEVAAYRIATEALTNVARHSGASSTLLRLSCDDRLHVEVTDDGTKAPAWVPGFGLQAMRERADEVGGVLEAGPAGPGGRGGRVAASLPLVAT
jgi:two-component system NarL family sensor kinase